MAYAKSYLGDTQATGIITKTVNSITALIPGVTCKSELAGLINAAVAEYYYDFAPTVTDTDAGEDFSSSNAGSKKAVMPLTRAFQIDEKIPNVAIESISADVVGDKMLKGGMALANRVGKAFITDLATLAQAKTYTETDFYEAIVGAIATFAGAKSVKVGGKADASYDNAENGVQPTTIIVGDEGRSKLFKTEAFQRLIDSTNGIPNLIGTMLGLNVVYSQHLKDADFIMLNAEGVAYPYALNTLRTVESENFNGVRVQGEVVVADEGNYSVLPIDSYAIKFTKA